MLKLLDGNKRLLVVLGFIFSGLVAWATGQDISHWLALGLHTFGWSDPLTIEWAQRLAVEVLPQLLAIWAAGHALVKMWRQHKAGATLTEINSTQGFAKLALAEGSVLVGDHGPVVK